MTGEEGRSRRFILSDQIDKGRKVRFLSDPLLSAILYSFYSHTGQKKEKIIVEKDSAQTLKKTSRFWLLFFFSLLLLGSAPLCKQISESQSWRVILLISDVGVLRIHAIEA